MADRTSGTFGAAGRLWRRVADGTGRLVDGVDERQQRHRLTAVPFAVVRKYSDDQAGRLTGQLSHEAFLAVFPLLLVLLTLVDIVLHGHPSLQADVVDSAVRQFPVLGPDLKANVHELTTTNTVALVVGLVWLSYGSMKLSRSAQVMMAVVWGVDRDELPDFWHWIPRATGFLVVLGVGFIAGGALTGLGVAGQLGPGSPWVGLLGSLVVNVLMFWGGFTVVIVIRHAKAGMWPGAVVAGLGWTLLQFGGAQLVDHQLRHLSNLYGTFATVLGLIWWLALAAMITVVASEFNVVVSRHLWPRSFRRVRHLDGLEGPAGRHRREGDPASVPPVGAPGPASTAHLSF